MTVVALACSPTPNGWAEWTAKFIAGRLVELHLVGSISERTVGRVTRKGRLNPWQKASWHPPRGVSGELVAAMEGVLEVYAEAGGPRLDFDECPVVLSAPGRPARIDSESIRNGTAKLFVVVEPAGGPRHVPTSTPPFSAPWIRKRRAELLDLARSFVACHHRVNLTSYRHHRAWRTPGGPEPQSRASGRLGRGPALPVLA